jgi:UDP-3-O-[3-hydroxymyristoyl] glucosamine N-acyltransferase
MRLSELANLLDGTLIGEDLEVTEITPLEMPNKNALSMVFSKKSIKDKDLSDFKAFVVLKGLEKFIDKPCILIEDSTFIIIKLIDIFYPEEKIDYIISDKADISKSVKLSKNIKIDSYTRIDENTQIDENTIIGANVTIGKNVIIGKNVTIYPNVTIYDNTVIKDNVIIHAGAVIGADGFGYVNTPQGHHKIRQVGNVILEKNVEIGANACVDRATFGSTIIGEGTKIDNLVQIAHNVTIGKHSIIVSQVGIAGSTNIGNFVMIGGQAGLPDHVNIVDGVIIGARTGVLGNIEEKGIYFGSPQIPHKDFMRNIAVAKDLYKMKKQLDSLLEDKKND